MLNEEKIRLMADLAVFEKKNGGRTKGQRKELGAANEPETREDKVR